MLSTHQASLNQLWASLLLEEFVRRGVRHICLAPGSRSTPLVMALAQQPKLQLHHHFDERGLGFLALGIAKGELSTTCSAPPVVIITTSGTAVANLYPAVIEAAQTGLKLLVISADRPPRLHNCGANQAIDQTGLFARYPRHSLYLPPPNVEYPADTLLAQVSNAVASVCDSSGGVAHINCMFDEPLYPGDDTQDFRDYLSPITAWLCSEQPYPIEPPTSPSMNPTRPSKDQWRQFYSQPGIIVVGALTDIASAKTVKILAQTLGWPLIADIQSQLKTDPDCLGLIDLLLCHESAAEQLKQPKHLLQFGNRLVSKRLQAFIEQQPWQQFWLVHPGEVPLAPGRNSSHFFSATVIDWCSQASLETARPQHEPEQSNPSLLELQRSQAQQLARQYSVANHPELSELAVAYQLLANCPDESWLMAGNSLSIRLLDLIGGNLSSTPKIFANRGASGIDGLVSTALGCGMGCNQPGTLLLGDYSLLYDLNALALLREHALPLVIVVLNNDGGGIFRMLPVADEALRQQHYQRPHGLDFADACKMFSIRYHRPATLSDFIDQYRQALTTTGPSLIEINVDAQQTEAEIRALTK
ncbi:MAG: 2-succinyl-5-enolpyruvyl-6-hydroxy-3-cyclohexene-1-carboxylic-acid synthase [Halopseudomonas sp.]